MSEKSIIVVYTDGSCSGNGNSNAIGGIGIHFPNEELKDISKVFRYESCTNQRTELYAILTAIRYIKQKLGLTNNKIVIKTDSQYSIDCITKWIYGWIKNGWMTKNNTPVANQEFIEVIHEYYEKYDITFEHVDAHTNKKDEDSVANAMADKLATMATKKAQMEMANNSSKSKKTYVRKKNIPINQKKTIFNKVPVKKSFTKPKMANKKNYPISDNIIVELIKAPK